MGADLCGYILVGPVHIDEEDRKEAIKHVTAVVGAVARVRELVENDIDPETELTDEERRLVDRVAEYGGMERWDDIGGYDCLSGKTPEEFVNDFVDMWKGGFFRDCMTRLFVDPRTGEDDQDFQIFVAGERTWGDGPENGSAWQLGQQADGLGILAILGLY